MNETETYGVSGARSGSNLRITSNLGGSASVSVSDPNLRDRIIDFVEEHADEIADQILEDLGLTNDEEDYDAYNPDGDID